MQRGWTQADVARAVRVSRAAVASWERDVRRLPAEALVELDFVYGAGGCLFDLARAIGSPQGFVTDDGPVPRRHWAHASRDQRGDVWAWIRPATGERLAGHSHSGSFG